MDEWMNNPKLNNIDPVKLELLRRAAAQTQGKSGKDMVPIMMALITSANKRGVRFSAEEIELILELLKEGKSKEEQMQIDQTIRMVQGFIKKHT